MKNGSPFSSLFVLLLALSILTSCTKEKSLAQKSDDYLLKEWVHSYEEETSTEEQIYRPFDLIGYPLSRYRNFYFFKENQVCEYLELAPNDAHQVRTGSWELVSGTDILIIRDKSGQPIATMEIIELTEDRLVLSPQQ
jgi:hypothetical protein